MIFTGAHGRKRAQNGQSNNSQRRNTRNKDYDVSLKRYIHKLINQITKFPLQIVAKSQQKHKLPHVAGKFS